MTPDITAVLMFVAVVCCGLFAGAAVYINAVEHPARLEVGPALALAEWAPSYRRATLMQAPLALVGGSAALGAWLTGAGRGWLLGGILLLAVVPVTFLAIMPTNHALLALLAPDAARDPERTTALLRRWNRLHAIRTVLSVGAFVLFTWLLVQAVSAPGAP